MTNIDDKKNLLVMFGGVSPEHEVSVITGLQVVNNANSQKYNVIPLYISKDGKWYTGEALKNAEIYKDLKNIPNQCKEVQLNFKNPKTLIYEDGFFSKKQMIRIDVAFPCFHGGVGENGAMQGLLQVHGIPYVGSDVLGSSLGMDKVVMKQILQQNNINVAPYLYFYKSKFTNNKIEEIESKLTYPMYVKPANAGSSIGISKVKNNKDLQNAIEVAFTFDRKIIIESGIENFKEINVSVIGIAGDDIQVSECEEVFASKDFLNYEDKYVGEGKSKGMASTKRQIPAKIGKNGKELIQKQAKKAFEVLNSAGLARIDFLFNENTNEYYLIEINTIPGSMSFYLWEATNMNFEKMIDTLVDTAYKRNELTSELTTTFQSNILKDFKSSLKSPKLS